MLTPKSARLIQNWSSAWIFDWRVFDSRSTATNIFFKERHWYTWLSYACQANRANQLLFHDIQATGRRLQLPASTSGSTRAYGVNKHDMVYVPGSIETQWDVVNARRWQKIDRTPSRSEPTCSLRFFAAFFRARVNTVTWCWPDIFQTLRVLLLSSFILDTMRQKNIESQ